MAHGGLAVRAALEVLQDLTRPLHHLVGQTGQLGYLDAVGPARAASHQLVQKHHVALELPHGHAAVAHSGLDVRQAAQLVEVCGEQGLGADPIVDVLGHGPGDGHTVIGGGPPPDLVEHHQAAGGGVPQDVRALAHLHHEGRLAPGEVVRGPHPREDAIQHAEGGPLRGHEAARVREQGDEGRLTDDGALARHVRPGDDDHLLLARAQPQVVGHEAAGLQDLLHHRVASVADLQGVAVVHLRAAVVVAGAHLGEGSEQIQGGQLPRQGAEPRLGARHLLAQLQKEPLLELHPPLLGVQHAGLVLGQLRGDVALHVHQGLLAHVVLGHAGRLGAGDLDGVTEDLVVLDLQGRDAGALALPGLDGEDPLLAPVAQRHELVELGAEAWTDDAPLPGARGGGVHQGLGEPLGQIFERVGRGPQQLRQILEGVDDHRRGHGLHDLRDDAQRVHELPQIPRRGQPANGPTIQPLEIVEAAQGPPQILPELGVLHQEGHRILPPSDVRDPPHGEGQAVT